MLQQHILLRDTYWRWGGTIEEGGTIFFSGPTPGALMESGALLQSGSQKENLRYSER